MELGSARWPEVVSKVRVLVPIGSTEQHGPHLPFATDAIVAEAVARGVIERLDDGTVLAPTVPYGASGEHAGFPGTVSIGHEALRFVVLELVRSLALWAGPIVFVNGHGGNVGVLTDVLAQARDEGHTVGWVPCGISGGDAHAGRTETSLMLHLRPDDVRTELTAAGATEPMAELLPLLRKGGVRAVSPNGVLGDPRGASAEEGRKILERMIDSAVARVLDPGTTP